VYKKEFLHNAKVNYKKIKNKKASTTRVNAYFERVTQIDTLKKLIFSVFMGYPAGSHPLYTNKKTIAHPKG